MNKILKFQNSGKFSSTPLLDLIRKERNDPEKRLQQDTSELKLFTNFISSNKGKNTINRDGNYFYNSEKKNWNFIPSEKPLESVESEIIDWVPGVGDLKGLTWDPIQSGLDNGIGAGLTTAGLGLIGLIPGVGDWIKKSKIKKLDDKIFNYETLNPKIVNISQNVKPSYKKWNTLNFEEELEKLNIVKQDKEDAIKLINFAKTFGYKLPKGIENYTGDLLDKEYKRILKQHNTFVRGINGNDYHFTTIPKYGNKVGAQQGMPEYAFGKYTTNALNNTSPYEKIGIVRRKLDFTGQRKDWIIKNHPLQYDKSVIPKINELFSYKLPDTWYKMDDKQLNLLYSTALKNFYLEHPNLSNKNKISFGGGIIHHGLPGEQVLDLINIYHPKKTNIDKDITKGFSKIRPKYNNSLRQWEDFTF